jgi:hypothetical protein
MIETPPPDAARHPGQRQPARADHAPARRGQLVLGGASRQITEPVAMTRHHDHQYP